MDRSAAETRATEAEARQPAPLNYAPPLPARWRRIWRFARWGILIAAIVLASKYGAVVWRRWEFLRLQAECMNAELPQDRPMMAAGLDQTRSLAAQSKEYQVNSGWAVRADPRWAKLEARLGLPAPAHPPATLFLHERYTSSGKRRLVVVEISKEPLSRGDLIVTVLSPADFRTDRDRSPPKPSISSVGIWSSRGRSSDGYLPPAQTVWGAGVPDPADRSRFTIPLEVLGLSETLRLKLEDDETVSTAFADEKGFATKVRESWDRFVRAPVVGSMPQELTVTRPELTPQQKIADAIRRLRNRESIIRGRAARELLHAEVAPRHIMQALVRAVEAGDFAAREGLTLAIERAQSSGKGVEAELAKADRETDPAARAFLNSANRAVAAEK